MNTLKSKKYKYTQETVKGVFIALEYIENSQYCKVRAFA